MDFSQRSPSKFFTTEYPSLEKKKARLLPYPVMCSRKPQQKAKISGIFKTHVNKL